MAAQVEEKRHHFAAAGPDYILESAYAVTEAITQEYSRSFYLATSLIAEPERRALRALYGFCRMTDNLVDDPRVHPLEDLEHWRTQVNGCAKIQTEPTLLAWADTRERYNVPLQYGNELIDGCELDLTRSRYNTWDALSNYCYCVASTVGLMSMSIVGLAPGIEFAQARPYAIKLGIALQLTNILRDIGEDASRGRIYLPLEDLERFGVSEDDILNSRKTPAFIALMRFQIERARTLYRESWPGIAMLSAKGRLSVAAAAELYSGILNAVEENAYDTFTLRAHVSGRSKLAMLPGIWWRARWGIVPAF